MSQLPRQQEALAKALQALSIPIELLNDVRAEEVKQQMLSLWSRFPLGEPLQSDCAALISRCSVLALGPARLIRLTQEKIPAIFLFDPENPEKIFLSLGENFPPFYWPSALLTTESISSHFGPYLLRRPFSVASLSRSIRISRSNLQSLGIKDLNQLAEIIASTEAWMDGFARWSNGVEDDPWPEDPSTAGMLSLRQIAEESRATHPYRFPSFSMRTLWSRSVLTVEQSAFDEIIFTLRYEPAPFIANHPNDPENALSLPDDIPADLLASLLRGPLVTLSRIKEILRSELDPELVLVALSLQPEPAQLVYLRALLRREEFIEPAIQIALAFRAYGLLGELEVETNSAEVRAMLAPINRLQTPQQEAQ